jgi:diguanylate cyclase (GGDEF)-like protein/PAS domain S-box-containing protein
MTIAFTDAVCMTMPASSTAPVAADQVGADEIAAAAEAQAEAEHRFRALAECAPVGIVLSEAGLRLGFVNDRFVELTGFDRDRLGGNAWLDVVHPDDLPGLQDALSQVLAGSSSELTVRLMPSNGTSRLMLFKFAPVITARRAAGFIGIVEDITARRAWENQLTYQATHDPLTGLANRRKLVETLGDLLEGGRSADRQFAVLFCDLDGFKQVNDTLGHDVGDAVLIEVGRRLAATSRENDLVCRVAGDEFVVILQRIRDKGHGLAAARRYLDSLTVPVDLAGRSIPISASVGLALPRSDDTPASLLRAADQGMYLAKTTCKGSLQVSPDDTRP